MARKLLILDCDGTIMDTIGAWHAADHAMTSEAGIELSKRQRDAVNAMTLEEACTYFHEELGIRESAQAVLDAMLSYLLEYYRTQSEANPGALEFVRAMSDASVPMCVLSSSPQSFLQAGLERGGFLPYVQHVISVEDLATTKRDIATYEHVCGLFGVERADSWLFDDSWYALRTAREAGCRTVGVFSADECGTHEELARYSDFVIDSFTELDSARMLALLG